MRFTLTLLAVFLLPLAAHAACTSPAGNAGEVVFSTTAKTMQYCNGTNWVNTGASNPAATQSGCTSPTGPAGAVVYNGSLGVIQFCNGQNWVNTACASNRTPGGSGCGGKPAGAIQYVGGSVNELQFCDSTNWVTMGWGCSGSGGSSTPADTTPPVWQTAATLPETEAGSGVPYSVTFTATDAVSSVTYSQDAPMSPAVPPGMAFNLASRTLSGTPNYGTEGTYTLILTATDASGNAITRTFTLKINPNSAPGPE